MVHKKRMQTRNLQWQTSMGTSLRSLRNRSLLLRDPRTIPELHERLLHMGLEITKYF
jgi:hypothetical protein